MSNLFQHQQTIWAAQSAQLEGIRDVMFAPQTDQGATAPVLQVVTGPHPGLQLSSWGVTGSISGQDNAALSGAGSIGVDPELVAGETDAGRAFTLVLGAGSTGLSGFWSDGAGGFGAAMPLGQSGASLPGDLTALVTHDTGAAMMVYGLRPGSQTPIQWELDTAGALRLRSAGTADADMAGLTSLAVAGDYVVASGDGSAVMRLYRVGNDGTLITWQTLSQNDNPGMSGPVELVSASIDGRDFVIAGASGSSSLTVYEVTSNGRLELRDHLIDSLDSRFANVTELETVSRGDSVYIAAAGSDSGVSLLQLSPSGQLVHMGVQADAVTWSMDGVAGMDLGLAADGALALVTSGLRDAGLSQFTYTPGAEGRVLLASDTATALTGTGGADLLEGGAGDDTLTGGAAADVLIDGAGSDLLTGGAGADVFVFVTDGDTDTVTDFDIAQDRLDLSGWAFLRNDAQLQINANATGAEIVFDGPAGREMIRLISADGAPLEADAVLAAVQDAPFRFLPDWLDATSLDRNDDPDPRAQVIAGGTRADILSGGEAGDTVTGAAGSDRMDGGLGGDYMNGGIGFDTLLGGGGDDLLRGMDGWDDLQGGTGNDVIYANNGSDLGAGDAGQDSLYGGLGGDTLSGGDGNDMLQGDAGADLLQGDAGDDLLRGNAGADRVLGGLGADTLEGGINHDTLDGGYGDDLIMAGNGSDNVLGGGGNDTLFGNAGNDRLDGGGGWDILNGGIGADSFVFAGGGTTVVADFQNNVDTLLLDRALWGGEARGAAQVVSEFGRIEGDNLILDFGGQGRVVLEGIGTLNALMDDLAFI